jgi:hypothetical protein
MLKEKITIKGLEYVLLEDEMVRLSTIDRLNANNSPEVMSSVQRRILEGWEIFLHPYERRSENGNMVELFAIYGRK